MGRGWPSKPPLSSTLLMMSSITLYHSFYFFTCSSILLIKHHTYYYFHFAGKVMICVMTALINYLILQSNMDKWPLYQFTCMIQITHT